MNDYFSILGAHIQGLVGAQLAPLPNPLTNRSLHYGDAAIMPLLPLISPSHDPLVPSSVVNALKSLEPKGKGHSWHGKAYSPPFDYLEVGGERNYSTWTEDGLSLGAMEVNELVYGGPSLNNASFSPAVMLWRMEEDVVGYMSVRTAPFALLGYQLIVGAHQLFPTEGHILGSVKERKLTITYPSPNLTAYDPTIFTLMFGPTYSNITAVDDEFLNGGFAQLPGLNISVSGNASLVKPEVSFNSSLNQKCVVLLSFPSSVCSVLLLVLQLVPVLERDVCCAA